MNKVKDHRIVRRPLVVVVVVVDLRLSFVFKLFRTIRSRCLQLPDWREPERSLVVPTTIGGTSIRVSEW